MALRGRERVLGALMYLADVPQSFELPFAQTRTPWTQ